MRIKTSASYFIMSKWIAGLILVNEFMDKNLQILPKFRNQKILIRSTGQLKLLGYRKHLSFGTIFSEKN